MLRLVRRTKKTMGEHAAVLAASRAEGATWKSSIRCTRLTKLKRAPPIGLDRSLGRTWWGELDAGGRRAWSVMGRDSG